METFKTAVVVALLLAVLAGVYMVLNKPDALPGYDAEASWGEPQHVELNIEGPQTAPNELAAATDKPSSSPRFAASSPAIAAPPTTGPSSAGPPSAGPPNSPGAAPMANQPSTARSIAAPAFAADAASTQSHYGQMAADRSNGALPEAPAEAAAPAPRVGNDSGPSLLNERNRVYETAATDEEEAQRSAPAVQRNPYAEQAEEEPSKKRTPPPVTEMDESFEETWQSLDARIEQGDMAEALLELSAFYRSKTLHREQRERMLRRLDALAGTVIYSRDHWLEKPYVVQRGDDLVTIAEQHKVPWRLLQNINAVRNPRAPVPGDELKLVRGPFRAEVDLTALELTLFLGDLYAGRFPIQLGDDPTPTPGKHIILDKQQGHAYYGANGLTADPGDPANPYGSFWLGLGGDVCMHAMPRSGKAASQGCIKLRPQDAADVYGILGIGSEVMILKD